MNENETNFRYLKYLNVKFLNSNLELKEAVLSHKEISTEKSSNKEKEKQGVKKSSE